MPHFSSRKGRIGATNCGKSRLFTPLNELSYNRLVFNPKGTTDRLLNPSVTLLRFIVLLTVHEDDASACFRPSSSTLTGLIVSRYSSIDPMLSYDRWVIVFSLFFYCIFRVCWPRGHRYKAFRPLSCIACWALDFPKCACCAGGRIS